MEFICAHHPQTIRASEDSCFANFRHAVNISALKHIQSFLCIWGVCFNLISVCANGKSCKLAWLKILNCVSGMSGMSVLVPILDSVFLPLWQGLNIPHNPD